MDLDRLASGLVGKDFGNFWKSPIALSLSRVCPGLPPPSSATANFRIVSEIHAFPFFGRRNGFGDALRKRQGPEKRS